MPKQDSITRAGWLLQQGYVQPGEEDTRQCWSQAVGKDKVYTTTVDSCTCYIGEYRKSMVCKHRWATFGAPAVCLILELRTAISQRDLESIGEAYKEAVRDVDIIFIAKARIEYWKRQEELKEMAA